MSSESDKMIKILLDAIWACPKPFTIEQLNKELNKHDMELKNIDFFRKLTQDFLFEENGLFRIDISNIPIQF